MVKVQKLPNGQLVITVPKKLAEFKGLGKGTEVVFREHSKDSILLVIENKKKD